MSIWTNLENNIAGYLGGSLRDGQMYPLNMNAKAWDDWSTRLDRYAQYDFFYTNTQYTDINKWALSLKEQGRLYTNIRSIYNPVFRLVNLYADKIYPAMIDLATLETGAIPIVGDDTLKTALKQLFRWSNWNADKQLYVRLAEKFGDGFIRIVDDKDSKRVYLEVVAPQKVRYMAKDGAGNIKEVWFRYSRIRDDRPTLKGYSTTDSRTIEITEIITPTKISIFEDDELKDEYDNPFGFVPVVHVKPLDEGFMYADARWGTSRSKINQINSLAALLADQARKSVIPYIATIGGAIKQGSLDRSSKTMDEVQNIAVGVGGDVKMIAPNLDIASVLNNIQAQLDELREDNPELLMFKLTDMNLPPSGVALKQFFDLGVNRILGAQGVYDDALIRACQMALTIGGVQGYTGFNYNIGSFDKGDLNFSIRPRDVIMDAVPQTSRVTFLMSSGAPQTGVWDALGVPNETQEEWKAEIKVEQAEQLKRDEEQALLVNKYNANTAEATGNPTANISGSPKKV